MKNINKNNISNLQRTSGITKSSETKSYVVTITNKKIKEVKM